jgi:aminomethyltransferase
LLNEDGGIIDDLIIYKLDDDEIMLVVNASRKDIDFDTLKSRIKSGSLTDKSQEIAKLDIQGKNSKKVLKKYFNDDINELKFFSFIQTKIFGKDCILSRTGYTGELGFEIYLDGETSIKLWDSLLKDGVKPAGLGARDLLRLEMGYSLYGNDLTQDITPLEANLKHFIDFEYDFFGKESLVKQKNHLKRILMPFKTTSRRSARKDFDEYQGDQKIGFVTSASYSPILNYGIGFAMVDIDGFDENKSFALKDKRGSIEANKTKIPFIKK